MAFSSSHARVSSGWLSLTVHHQMAASPVSNISATDTCCLAADIPVKSKYSSMLYSQASKTPSSSLPEYDWGCYTFTLEGRPPAPPARPFPAALNPEPSPWRLVTSLDRWWTFWAVSAAFAASSAPLAISRSTCIYMARTCTPSCCRSVCTLAKIAPFCSTLANYPSTTAATSAGIPRFINAAKN